MASTELALRYLATGWSVVPCHVPVAGGCSGGRDTCSWPGKHPRVPWRQFSERLPTEGEIVQWFDVDYYESNIGLVTGTISNTVVIDVDGAEEVYPDLELPRTLTSITGRRKGGRHYFFECDLPLRSSVGFIEGMDLKADGGFVVLPPSLHQSGYEYEWTVAAPMAVLELDKLPAESLTAIRSSNEDSSWFRPLLEGVVEGERSAAAVKLVGRYSSLGLSVYETGMIMFEWNTHNVPPLPLSELSRAIKWRFAHRSETPLKMETMSDVVEWLLGHKNEGN